MSFLVRCSAAARGDLKRLYGYLIERAQSAKDLELAERAYDAIVDAVEYNLSRWPFVCRKAAAPSCASY